MYKRQALGVVTVIFLISGKDDASIKLSWVIPLLAVPVFGTLFYLFFRLQTRGKRIHRRFRELGKQMEDYMQQDPEVMSRVVAASGRQGNLVRYMNRFGPYPIYENTKVEYFPLGDDFFPALLRELKMCIRDRRCAPPTTPELPPPQTQVIPNLPSSPRPPPHAFPCFAGRNVSFHMHCRAFPFGNALNVLKSRIFSRKSPKNYPFREKVK